jgi:hypothetical protein
MGASIPISMPEDLLEVVRLVAKETNLSQQDVIRQSVKLGLPKLREQFNLESLLADTWDKLGPAPEVNYDKL